MELQKGRPADTAGRLEKEIRTYDLLDRVWSMREWTMNRP